MFLQIFFALLSCLLHYYINTRKKHKIKHGMEYTPSTQIQKDSKKTEN